MKKFIAILLAIALVTPFTVGCGDKKTEKKTEEKSETKTESKT